MEVILLKHLDNLGRRGQVVKVAAGYARNYLLPRRMAVLATAGAKRLVEQESRKFQALDTKARDDASGLASQLASTELEITAKADEDGKLYGSVGVNEIFAALVAKDFPLERKQVLIEHPFKSVGSYEANVRLHLDVRGTVKVNVVAE